jgi:aryl-alcohol dehydrogenase-like predicted oxidoreductase
MKYRYLGRTGILVSEFTLGTMSFGAPGWGCDRKEAASILLDYIDAGGNLVDTADVYAKGEAESIIGEVLDPARRERVLLASKCGFPFGDPVGGLGSSRRHMVASVEGSLKRMKTDYIDLFYLHRPDPTTPMEEVLETLEVLTKQGKILHSAFSNLPAWRLALADQAAKNRFSAGFACGQYLYNLADRSCEQEIIPAMLHQGIGFLAWSPLAGGLLTGKYQGNAEVPAGSRFDFRKGLDVPRFWNERSKGIALELALTAQEIGTSPARLALAWLLSKNYVSSVILGPRTRTHVSDSLAAASLELPEDLVARLDGFSQPTKNYLWGFNEETNAQFSARGRLFPGAQIV